MNEQAGRAVARSVERDREAALNRLDKVRRQIGRLEASRRSTTSGATAAGTHPERRSMLPCAR
jgi:hypothetical protein